MASWSLGKIFQTEEVEKEPTQDPSDSGSDSEDDEDVLERQAAFNKGKQQSQPRGGDNGEGSKASDSIRRYDEFGDFLSRSERAHHERLKDTTISAKAASGLGVSDHANHRVSFAPDDSLTQVHEISKLQGDDKKACFMGTDDWVSIDTDIDLTTKRWGYHMEGKLAFDEDNNTIRGIEDMIFRLNKNKPIMKHRQAVLEEVVRQKTENEYPNWERLSEISRASSILQTKMAVELGREDELEKNRIWAPKPVAAPTQAVSLRNKKKDKKVKRKSSFFGLFKKKS